MRWVSSRRHVSVRALVLVIALGLPAWQAAVAAEARFRGIFEPVSYAEDINLRDVFFVSETEGWVAGDKGTILHTKDAGATWTAQMGGDPQSQEGVIWKLQFLDARRGWASTQSGSLLRTTDGENWEVVNPKINGYAPRVFSSPTNGAYIVGETVYHTRDAGRTWKPAYRCHLKIQHEGMMQEGSCHLEELAFADDRTGFAISRELPDSQIAVLRTGDGGASWQTWTARSEVGAKDGSLFFLDRQTGYAVLWSKKLVRTADGGKTWTGVSATVGQTIRFADPEVGWSPYYSNGHHLSWTTDGGRRWLSRPVALPAKTYINGFSLPSRRRGYVVGDHGMIFRYSVVPADSPLQGIDAPAMPVGSETLEADLREIRKSAQALQTRLNPSGAAAKAARASGPDRTASQSDAESNGFEGSTGAAGLEGFEQDVSAPASDFVQGCCAAQINELQSDMSAFLQDVPVATARHRNLNMLFAGLRMVADLIGKASAMRGQFRALKMAPDGQAASAALQSLVTNMESAAQTLSGGFAAPPLIPDGAMTTALSADSAPAQEPAREEPENQAAQRKESLRDRLKEKLKKLPQRPF